MLRSLLVCLLIVAAIGCAPSPEEVTQVPQLGTCPPEGCGTGTTGGGTQDPGWFANEGLNFRFPSQRCSYWTGDIPLGTTCTEEVVAPATYCSDDSPVNPTTFGNSPEAQHSLYRTATWHVDSPQLPMNGAPITVWLYSNMPTEGTRWWSLTIQRRAAGILFRYGSFSPSAVYPRASSTGGTARVYGLTSETLTHPMYVSDLRFQVYRPTTQERLNRNDGWFCSPGFGPSLPCAVLVHAMTFVDGGYWFLINQSDGLGVRRAQFSPKDVADARYMQSSLTCLTQY